MQQKNNLQSFKCKRCGRCCTLDDNKPCDYLVVYRPIIKTGVGSSYCMIYKHRLGAILRTGQICTYRSDVKKKFPGCPYNELP
jgi:hypothetical protein